MSTILIVDDDRNTRDGLERALKSRHNVFTAPDARTALQILSANPIDVILSDVRMPGLTGLEFLAEVRASHPATPFILLTAYGSVETAVEAMKAGAYDFLTKPVNLDHLDILVERAVAERALRARAGELQSQNASLRRQLDEKFGMENIIGSSAAMKPVFDTIRAAAPTSATVLVTGPSGTGKELVAHAIHNLSRRSSGPFVAVNCAALPASLLESELFGHEKGAFTGADTRRKGRFELASGGTLFLDEIGEIDQATQVKLLRVLEDRRFERVGGTETVEADFRLVAATNKDLPALVSAGAFREDLFYRLSVIDIRIPPLAERADDIPALTMAFLKEFAEKNGKDVRAIAPEALDALCLYPWPGNVRELRNTIERMVVLASGDTLGLSDIPQRMRAAPTGPVAGPTRPAGESLQASPSPAPYPPSAAGGSLKSAEREKILSVLARHGGNRSRAAQELGISRRTIIRKIAEYSGAAR